MADDNSIIKLFGFELKRTIKSEKEKKNKNLESIVPPVDEDGAGYVTSASGSRFAHYIDLDGTHAKDNAQLIMKYRGVATHPEVDSAIEDIVNEAIAGGEQENPVSLNLDNIKASNPIKKKAQEEFEKICSMLDFNKLGYDIFRSFYIDGRLFFHLVVNEETKEATGIEEIRPIDATKIRKMKKLKYERDEETGTRIVKSVEEFFIFQQKAGSNTGARLTPDSVAYVTSGLLDPRKRRVVSYLDKALKPINQLRMMEDSLVIYRLARAPERRIFYIDTGNMGRNRSEAYIERIMRRYRNKLVYDASTGELKDDRKHMHMLEDYWLPRKEGGRGTEISTLPGGENLGQIEDILYFQKRLYRSLNVPINRLEQEAQFSLGRSTEITRDEVKFQKFIDKLRRRFSMLFYGILKKQLLLKKIITPQDWELWKNDITIDYLRDNHFTELKNNELMQDRLATMDAVSSYVGEYFSREWVMKNIMRMTDDDIEVMRQQVEKENQKTGSEEEDDDDDDDDDSFINTNNRKKGEDGEND